MSVFLNAISAVTGPLTLVAFLAVVILAIFRRSVNDKKGLKYIYDLFRDKLTKDQFYNIVGDIINRVFWTFIIVFTLSILAFVVTTLLSP